MVRPDETHFRYADGTWFYPFGTTVYAFSHQEDERVAETFETLAEAYGIETIPTLALLHHGKAQDALIAPQSKHEVLAFLKEHKLIA